jgi:hypothetical protein
VGNGEDMTDPEARDDEGLSSEELARQSGEPLPDREAMSTISGTGVDNFAVPINEALAVNIESVDSYAIADADQVVILNQVDVDGVDEPVPDTGDGATDDAGHGPPDHARNA